jgi:hypothetical protein
MMTRKSRAFLALVGAMTTFLSAGCNSVQQETRSEAAARPDARAVSQEMQGVAEVALGKQAEVVAHGNLARNGLEQLLVVNRFGNAARGNIGSGNSSVIFVTRAAVVEKNGDKWAEVLRCDEHLKNPRGYLGGSPSAPVTGWQLEFDPDTQRGLELRFTPAEAGQERSSNAAEAGNRTIAVRWNTKAKRYQSLDRSHEGYLGEAPTLETPQSILK